MDVALLLQVSQYFAKIESPYIFCRDFKCKDRNKTNKYYDNYLSTDKHMVDYDYWCKVVVVNKGNIKNPYGSKFVLPIGAIIVVKVIHRY